jgi:hypothetical protein
MSFIVFYRLNYHTSTKNFKGKIVLVLKFQIVKRMQSWTLLDPPKEEVSEMFQLHTCQFFILLAYKCVFKLSAQADI